MPQRLSLSDLVDMRDFIGHAPIDIDLVYAKAAHPENIFGCAIYRANAPFLLYKTLADIVLHAARTLHNDFGWTSVLMDGLRPIEAQQAMQETDIVKANMHWCEGPNRMLSPPGMGGHPRAMAVDIVCLNDQMQRIDMGTAFDHLSEDPNYNPAARAFRNLPSDVLQNRLHLENAMMEAARYFEHPLLPLPAEWWDFRFPADIYNQYAPLSNTELPIELRMM